MKNVNSASAKRLFLLLFFAFILILIGISLLAGAEVVQANPLIVISFLINIVIFFVQLLKAIARHAFSFNMMHWLFCLFFLGYAPLLQHLTNKYSWGLLPDNHEILRANLFYLLWSICYLLGQKVYNFQSRNKRRTDFQISFISVLAPLCKGFLFFKKTFLNLFSKIIALSKDALTPIVVRVASRLRSFSRSHVLTGLLFLAIILTVVDILSVGFFEQFFRSTSSIETGNPSINLLLTHYINNSLLFIAVVFIFEDKCNHKLHWRTLIALLCLLIACFPTGLSRNMMASLYAGLLIFSFDNTKKGRWFSLVIIFGLVLIFPVVEIFRQMDAITKQNFLPTILSCLSDSYLQGHYDSHQMIISAFRYTDQFGFTFGKQLLGALLFFIPRSVWGTKPEGTGHTVIKALDQYHFTNVSANVATEGYINFGVIGIIIFAILIGFAISVIDDKYWEQDRLSLLAFLYPFEMFMFFFFMRGDMMSAWSYSIAQIIVGSSVYIIYRSSQSIESNRFITYEK